MIQPFLVFGNWTILFLRVVLGVVMVSHGLPKLKDLQGTGKWLESVGFRPGGFWALVAGLVEFVGGLFLIFGFLTQFAALLIALQFVVVLLKVKRKKIFSRESELDWFVLVTAVALAALGGGVLSLDGYLGLILF